jgi:hypothetical protein
LTFRKRKGRESEIEGEKTVVCDFRISVFLLMFASFTREIRKRRERDRERSARAREGGLEKEKKTFGGLAANSESFFSLEKRTTTTKKDLRKFLPFAFPLSLLIFLVQTFFLSSSVRK